MRFCAIAIAIIYKSKFLNRLSAFNKVSDLNYLTIHKNIIIDHMKICSRSFPMVLPPEICYHEKRII